MPNIVVIGASAGGVEPLCEIMRGLPANFAGAVFVVMHLAPTTPSVLPSILSRAGRLPAFSAEDGDGIEPGRIYVAPPDLHLLIQPGRIHLMRGPRENRHRPAIDPLFRTAAHAYGARVVGVVLTGMLDDGAQGLHVIKSEGGVAIVQNPSDAMFTSMPTEAIQTVDVDFILRTSEIAPKIVELAHEKWAPVEAGRARALRTESPIPEGETVSEVCDERLMGEPSIFICPDCNGTLWEVQDGDLLRFRCRVGHAFSTEAMRNGYPNAIEGALWSAVRILKESASLERRLAEQASTRGDDLTAVRFNDVAQGREQQAEMIRRLLTSEPNPESEPKL